VLNDAGLKWRVVSSHPVILDVIRPDSVLKIRARTEAHIMAENPYVPPQTPGDPPVVKSPGNVSASKATYNVVSDTVTGINVRGSDNKSQAKFVAASVGLFALAGAVLALINPKWQLPWYGGAMAGAFAGLVVGVFASGIFLMIYRASRHIKGKHD